MIAPFPANKTNFFFSTKKNDRKEKYFFGPIWGQFVSTLVLVEKLSDFGNLLESIVFFEFEKSVNSIKSSGQK